MQHYSPFGKAISDLESVDLATLRTVHEGWYVEYKRELVSPKSVAKAVSAFANTYGGWLFLGVQECGGESNTAATFPGISLSEASQATQQLRQSLNQHLQPVPFYESKILTGPCETIELGVERSVIAIRIPQSVTAPHIHSDGRIYRRVADSSEPQPLTDRFLLDQLSIRSDRMRVETEQWIDRDPEFSDDEMRRAYLRVMLSPDLSGQLPHTRRLSLDVVRDALAGEPSQPVMLPFDTIFPTANGYVARQTERNDPQLLSLTLYIYDSGSCDVIIPLRHYSLGMHELREELARNYLFSDQFVATLDERGFFRDSSGSQVTIIDLNILFHVLWAVTRQYRAVLRLITDTSEFHFKARILHCWRKIAFLDLPQILEQFGDHGVPVLMYDQITAPSGVSPESFLFLRDESTERDEDDAHAGALVQSVQMFVEIAQAFGLAEPLGSGEYAPAAMITELVKAGNRGVQAMQP